MSMGQMLMVLLAVILFSTIIITIYNNMFFQLELAEDKLFYTQAIKISDFVFQQFEIEMVSGQKSFNKLYEDYKYKAKGQELVNATNKLGLQHLGVDYKYTILSEYCDSSGNTAVVADSSHQKVTVTIGVEARGDSLFLGSYNKVFSDMSLGGGS